MLTVTLCSINQEYKKLPKKRHSFFFYFPRGVVKEVAIGVIDEAVIYSASQSLTPPPLAVNTLPGG